mmetsp:Transcript_26341/g.72386  ORF Transcript_26341/g.72386 Transcript_26341/m.72386 type:complete len:303 (+) Transcript_26341:243-1151(+)
MKDNDRERLVDQTDEQLEQKEPDQVPLESALSKAIQVTENESFDPSHVSEHRPGGADLRKHMEERWNELIRSTTGKSKTEATDRWFRTIYEKHNEAGRHYHTAVHLWEMFELLDIVIACVFPPLSLASKWYVPMAWSVLFHDSIYDPQSNRNEKDSAALFREFVHVDNAIEMEEDIFDAVLTMILATETHQVTANKEEEADAEFIEVQKHFLDIDMAVLGKQKAAYMKYAALIRREYKFVQHDVYCSKRAEILERFLGDSGDANTETKQIYTTEAFRNAFESRARENLRQEINLLRTNTIPT